MQRRRKGCFQLFSFRLEELAVGNHAEKVGPSGEREGKTPHFQGKPEVLGLGQKCFLGGSQVEGFFPPFVLGELSSL